MGREGHRSDFAEMRNAAETLDVPTFPLGQRNPQEYPQHYPTPKVTRFPLGEPMDIEDVAAVLGCSAWTVRQKYLPAGLPHLRASAHGRIVFFREQVIHWILERQAKGGMRTK